jgi:mono/diheme cytochrome c family protein
VTAKGKNRLEELAGLMEKRADGLLAAAKAKRAEAEKEAKKDPSKAKTARADALLKEREAEELREGAAREKERAKVLEDGDAEARRAALKATELASIVRGYEIFTSPSRGNCVSCHIDFGRQSKFRYDDWGTLVRPANLTAGIYRGGRRPLDHYYRVRLGIPPSGMTLPNIEDWERWDVVNFVQALPYPQMLPGAQEEERYGRARHEKIINIRDAIYAASKQKEGAGHGNGSGH